MCCILVLLVCVWLFSSRKKINIPGPKGYPIIGVEHLVHPSHKAHVNITRWSRQYGPVIYVPRLVASSVFVSGQEAIYEVTIKKGRVFGGRGRSVRSDYVSEDTGILTSSEADETWKFLRKISQRHLRQFGDGMSRIESVIDQVGDDMFALFARNSGKPFDPHQAVFDAAINSIAFLITGERTQSGDALVEKMRHYEDRFLRTLNQFTSLSHYLFEYIPCIRYFGVKVWRIIQKMVRFEEEIWQDIKTMNDENPQVKSLCKTLMSEIGASSVNGGLGLTEKDARRTSMNLLLAGVTTTSNTFYAAVNILAHHPRVQDVMLREISSFYPDGDAITLEHRPKMHYCKAFLLELLRYSSVVSLSVSHRAVEDATIQGYAVPKNTRVQINIYGLHHDPDFWKDPDNFRPERFLDENDELVPADHPNRKHTMSFGAGPRVCLGETLAMTRLFLWITTFVSRFKVQPAKGNDRSTLDTKQFYYIGVLRPTRYEVLLSTRKDQ